MSNLTVKGILATFESYVGKPRTELPWLKGRIHMLDCAAAVSHILGLPDMIGCSQLKKYLEHKGTWTTKGTPKPGDIVIFDWTGKKTETDHTGIVIKADAHKVYYVSADSTMPIPGKVSINSNGVGYSLVTGWGTPVAYADVAPVAPTKPAAPVVEPTPTPAAPKAPKAPSKAAQKASPVTHVVVKGETLTGIAAHYKVTVDAIVKANKISNPNLIAVGQHLTIPVS
jgi:LysM repeat protein